MAYLIHKSWKGDIETLYWFGFLRGRLSKAFFLLFCTCLCFPVLNKGTFRYLKYINGYILIIASVMNMLKYCNNDEEKEKAFDRDPRIEKEPIY